MTRSRYDLRTAMFRSHAPAVTAATAAESHSVRRVSMLRSLILPVLGGILLLVPMLVHAQADDDPAALIDRVQAQFERVEDYRVDIRAEVDMQGLSVPEMKATVFYKKPDRMHVESDGFAMLPRDAVAFRPTMFEKDQYDMVIQGREKIRGHACVKVRLFARSDTIRLQRVMLYVDPSRDLILRADIDPGEGSSAQVDMTYTQVDNKYWLPERIEVTMDSPMRFRQPGMKPPDSEKKSDDRSASIVVRYSNYAVNKGIPDAIFEKSTQ